MPAHSPIQRKFEASDPHWEARVRDSFGRQRLMEFIGAELAQLQPGRCEIRLPCRDDLTQQHGYIHAGIISTIVDNAGGYAGFSLMPADASVLSVEFKINLLAAADGELLIASGEVLKAGRTLVITRGDVHVVKDGRSTHCATMQQTLMTMRGLSERA